MSKIKWSNRLDAVHSQLKETNDTLHAAMTAQTPASGKDSSGDMKVNTLAINIEFQLSAQSKHGKSNISLPINIPGHKYFSVVDSFCGRDITYSEDSLEARHVMGRDPIHQNDAQINGPKHYSGTTTYSTSFHHSEQAFYEYIIQRSNLDDIATRLKNHGIQDGTTVTAVTIHMHSIRYVCGNCEIGGLGLMEPQYGFTDTLSKALEHQGLRLAQGARFNIEVSADKPYGRMSPKLASTHKYGDLSTVTGVIVESDTAVVTLPPSTTDLHSRTIMLSTDSGALTQKCSSVFDDIRQQEYAAMIQQGHVVRDHVRTSGNDMRFIDVFTALALIPDVNSTSSMQVKRTSLDVVNTRAKFDIELRQDRRLLEETKHTLLQVGADSKVVRNLSQIALYDLGEQIKEMRQEYDNNDDLESALIGIVEVLGEYLDF